MVLERSQFTPSNGDMHSDAGIAEADELVKALESKYRLCNGCEERIHQISNVYDQFRKYNSSPENASQHQLERHQLHGDQTLLLFLLIVSFVFM